MRLDKFLCEMNIGSRSEVKALLKQGLVTLNGAPVCSPNQKIDPKLDTVCFQGKQLEYRAHEYFMLHKPAGYVTSTDNHDGITVMSLLPQELLCQDLKPVGRLDKQTEGLLLFTNDGDLLHRLISPKKEVPKVYYARHEGTATAEDVEAFAHGLTLRDGTVCLPAVLEPIGAGESLITVCEGKYHQVRRMMASRNMTVLYLERRKEGALTLEGLERGQIRELTAAEIVQLEQNAQS